MALRFRVHPPAHRSCSSVRGVVGGGCRCGWEDEDDAVPRLSSSRVGSTSDCHSLSRRFEKSGPFPVAACLVFPLPLCVPAVVYICGLFGASFDGSVVRAFPGMPGVFWLVSSVFLSFLSRHVTGCTVVAHCALCQLRSVSSSEFLVHRGCRKLCP